MLKPRPVTNSDDSPPAEGKRSRPLHRVALRWLGLLGLVGGLFYLLLRKIDLEQFAAALRGADLRLVFVSALLGLVVCNGAAIARLWVLLKELPHARRPLGF